SVVLGFWFSGSVQTWDRGPGTSNQGPQSRTNQRHMRYAIRHLRGSIMSPSHRRYLVLEQGVGAAIVNFVLNAAIAALLFYSQATIPLWGTQSIAGDTIGTTFFLPFLTCLIVTRVARGQMRGGRPIGLGWTRTSHPVLGWLPIGTLRRGLAFGL